MGDEPLARRAAPYAVLFPGAVWVGVSADGLFAGVLAWGVALLAVAVAQDRLAGGGRRAAAGLLLGGTVYLSYGLVLGGLLAAAVPPGARAPCGCGAAAAVAGAWPAQLGRGGT